MGWTWTWTNMALDGHLTRLPYMDVFHWVSVWREFLACFNRSYLWCNDILLLRSVFWKSRDFVTSLLNIVE